jgi:hypothetical protein
MAADDLGLVRILRPASSSHTVTSPVYALHMTLVHCLDLPLHKIMTFIAHQS